MPESVFCPVCNEKFDLQIAASHVNNCLDRTVNEASNLKSTGDILLCLKV